MRIEVAGVGHRYDSTSVLRDVHLVLPSGSVTVCCGQTGSGKSTLLQILAGLVEPSEGVVTYSEVEPRRRMGMVFQSPDLQIFAGTVEEDVAYGLEVRRVAKQVRQEQAAAALRRVGLEPDAFRERSPFLLSGGEKRRVVIAGALAMGPEVLLLDEPTAGLDPAACRELVALLVELKAQGLTIVISTHDLEYFLTLADQIVVMQSGQIHYQGSPQDLLAHPTTLLHAGLDLPPAARLAHRLRERGFDLDLPLTTEALVDQLKAHPLVRHEPLDEHGALDDEHGTIGMHGAVDTHGAVRAWDWEEVREAGAYVQRLDPRTKWLAMVALSVAFLQLSHLGGVVAGLVLVASVIKLAELSWRKMMSLLRPFVLMFSFLWLVTAIRFGDGDLVLGPVGFSYEGAQQGALGIARFLLVIALGLIFTETTTGAPLREGFEWGIRPLRRLGVPTRDLSLAVSIVLQFVPWILGKVIQLRQAMASRGQDAPGLRNGSPRQVVRMLLPLLILVIKMGDELATAIESRGYNRGATRVSLTPLRWQRRDTWASGAMIAIAGLIVWLG